MNDEMRREYEEKKRELKEQGQKVVKGLKEETKKSGVLGTVFKVALGIFLFGGKK